MTPQDSDLKYKFCIISYIAGSRGSFLGYQLWQQYPTLFSLKKPPIDDTNWIENYDTWHTYTPHFANELFFSHPVLHLDNLFNAENLSHLHKNKYNIIVTHQYTDEELEPIHQALSGHTVKTLQVWFEELDKQRIFDRAVAAATHFGHNTGSKWKAAFLKHVIQSKRASNVIPVPLAILKNWDKQIPTDLTFLMEHFKL
jgi:hypothetical protein